MFEKKVLIAGGCGFVGSHLANEILKGGGTQIYVLDNLTTAKFYAKPKLNPKIDFEYGNVEDISIIEYYLEKVKKFDYIFHLASPASPRDFESRPFEIFSANIEGTKNMLELARKNDCPLLLASSSEIYGQVPLEEIPIKESYWGNTNPVGVRSPYDESKRCAEAMTMSYHRTYGIDTKIARIFNTYGPHMSDDGRVMSTFINKAIDNQLLPVQGDGKQTRTFLYIDDLVEGLIKLIKSPINTPVNLGAIDEITILELANIINKLTKNPSTNIKYIKRNKDDPEYRKPDVAQAKTLLGWEPKIALEKGLRITIDSYIIDRAARIFR